jgi:glycine betaine/proline transport system permease protein
MNDRIPLARFVDNGVMSLQNHFGDKLDLFSHNFNKVIDFIEQILLITPWWGIVIIFVLLAYWFHGWKFAIGTTVGLSFIFNLGLWTPFLDTLTLVVFSAVISIIIGIPLGILAAKEDKINWIISPILDFMQTITSFVYLIPALLFFGIGKVPAVFATVVFAMPPAIRFTNLGIRQVPVDLIEVGEAFGSNSVQLLWKIQLPLALPTIMAGINQTMMLSLSMAVIAAMIGAGGLGGGVLEAIGQLKIGMGFEYGIAVVIMAIILDRISQGLGRSFRTENNK